MTDSVLEEKYVIYTGDCEWDALYVDGKLHTLGERTYILEAYEEILGVRRVDSEAYFLGREPKYDNAAKTLAEVEAYRTGLAATPAESTRASELRAQAAALLVEADKLDDEQPQG